MVPYIFRKVGRWLGPLGAKSINITRRKGSRFDGWQVITLGALNVSMTPKGYETLHPLITQKMQRINADYVMTHFWL